MLLHTRAALMLTAATWITEQVLGTAINYSWRQYKNSVLTPYYQDQP
jgi:hypothetical protein